MFNSGKMAAELISEIESEADIALPIPKATWVLWLNELEYLLYSEIIRQQRRAEFFSPVGELKLEEIEVDKGQAVPLPDDVYQVYADKRQLIQSTVNSGVIFPDTWYIDGNVIRYNTEFEPNCITLIYFERPELKKVDENGEISADTVRVPYGFLDMVKSRLRGEAYKLVNEDLQAAKWINDYNIHLENFKVYISNRQPAFGV